MATKNEAAIQALAATPIQVHAAGALCWRVKDKVLQVLLIHRPNYDDWSFPKGKQDPGEALPQTAVREVFEEVNLQVRLGIPLPHVDYLVKGKHKQVKYWAAADGNQKPKPDGKEVDEVQWVGIATARTMLTNRADVAPLDALAAAFDAGTLSGAWPLIIVRHAKAKPRSTWTRAEGERTLAASGRRQAISASNLLQAWKPKHVVSSPWERCVQTITPYMQHAAGSKLKLVDSLTEANHKRRPERVAKTIAWLFNKARPVIVCVHRPTLPTILSSIGEHLSSDLRKRLPQADPYLAPGEILVFQIVKGKAFSVEQYKPFDD